MKKGAVWHGVLADYWVDDDDILHGISKDAPRNAETVKENFDLIRQITGGKKVCVIIDNTHTKPYNIEDLKTLIKEGNQVYRAVAYVSRSPIGKMVGGISEQLNPHGSAPIRVFDNTENALKWIRGFFN